MQKEEESQKWFLTFLWIIFMPALPQIGKGRLAREGHQQQVIVSILCSLPAIPQLKWEQDTKTWAAVVNSAMYEHSTRNVKIPFLGCSWAGFIPVVIL